MAEENKTVDVSTDDLDDFNDLWEGRASETPKETEEDPGEEVETEDAPKEADEEVEEVNETDEDSVATEDEEEAPKGKKNSAQERINELTKNWRETQRELEALKAERQKQDEPKEQEETKEPETASKAPDPSDREKYPLGDLDPQYLADRQDYMFEKRIAELDAKQKEDAQQAQAEALATQRMEAWNEKIAEAEAKHEDYRETVGSLESAFDGIDPDHGQFLADTIMSMESGTDVLYHLAQNPDLAVNIAGQNPVNAALALGRLEASLAEPAAPKPTVKASKAPNPPKSLNKGNSPRLAIKPDTDDLDAFEDVFFDKK